MSNYEKVKVRSGILAEHRAVGIDKYAKLAEDIGFDDVWFTDHYFLYDIFVAETLAALETETINIGSNVCGVYLRHPCLFASSVASVDNLSGGRAIFGLGAGGWEFPQILGVDYSRPRTACKEAIEIVRGLWRGETVTYSGKVYNTKKAKLMIESRSDIPILVGARGPRMFELAGELGDGSTAHGVTPAYIDYMVKQIKKGAKNAGRSLKNFDIAITPIYVLVTKDVDVIKEELRSMMTNFVTGFGSEQEKMLDLLDLPHEEVARVRKASRSIKREIVGYQPSPKVVRSVSDNLLDKLVNAFCIIGNVEECISKIEEMKKAGVTHIIIDNPIASPGKIEEWKKNIELLGKKIVQSFKENSR